MPGAAEGADREVEGDVAAQRDGEAGHVGGRVVAVGDDDEVAGEGVAVLGEEAPEAARAVLLLALDEYRQADREGEVVRLDDVAHGLERGEVHEHARLVVARAAAVEALADDGGLEGRGAPVGLVAGGLHVVVGVEEVGRRAVLGGAVGDDAGLAHPALRVLVLVHLDALEQPGRLEQLAHGLGAAGDGLAVEGVPRDRGDADEVGEAGDGARHAEVDAVEQFAVEGRRAGRAGGVLCSHGLQPRHPRVRRRRADARCGSRVGRPTPRHGPSRAMTG